MSKFGVLIAAAGLVFATCAHAEDASPPLFAAFRSFCADTHAVPSAVKQAVEEAGGKLRNISKDGLGYPMSSTVWDVTVGGRAFSVSAAAASAPLGSGKIRFSAECLVASLGDEAASIAPLRRWTAVAPASESGTGIKQTIFLFRDEGPAHVAIDGATPSSADHWMLTLMESHRVNSVQLMHFSQPEAAHRK
jgi:hypothetical protein